MSEYLFDPGYGKHLSSFIYTVEPIYEKLNGFKNYKQKQVYFTRCYPVILKLISQNTGFYSGCLLWAVYLKTLPEGNIINNHCLGQEFEEKTALVELIYFREFVRVFPKDVKFYLNKEFIYNDDDILEAYRQFALLNEGFVNTRKNTDIKLPECIKTLTNTEIKEIYETVQAAVISGDFNGLTALKGLINEHNGRKI